MAASRVMTNIIRCNLGLLQHSQPGLANSVDVLGSYIMTAAAALTVGIRAAAVTMPSYSE